MVVEFPLITQAKERGMYCVIIDKVLSTYVCFWLDDHHHQLQQIGDAVKEFNFDEFFKSAFEPKVSDDKESGGKKIQLSLDMTGFRPDQIQIHLKDHDLIVQVIINQIEFSILFSFV